MGDRSSANLVQNREFGQGRFLERFSYAFWNSLAGYGMLLRNVLTFFERFDLFFTERADLFNDAFYH